MRHSIIIWVLVLTAVALSEAKKKTTPPKKGVKPPKDVKEALSLLIPKDGNGKKITHLDLSFRVNVSIATDMANVWYESANAEAQTKAGKSEKAEAQIKPGKSEKAEAQIKPKDPSESDSSENRNSSDKPDDPSGSDSSEKPESPDKPDDPSGSDSSEKPESPDKPDTPETPKDPSGSYSSDEPVSPENPDDPSDPDSPDKPDDPSDKPDTPVKPDPEDNEIPDAPENNEDAFVVASMEDLAEVPKHSNVVVNDLDVPAGETLQLNLKQGATLTFNGHVTFGYKQWSGPLIYLKGKDVTVIGGPNNLLDGDGKRWWDGKGEHSKVKKPKFFFVRVKKGTIKGLNVKNTPMHGFSVNTCNDLTISNIHFDNSAGATKLGGHNTDAFDVGNVDNIVIKDSVVYNQDDCLAVNSGSNIVFENNFCSGGHGISIGSVGGRKLNVVENVLMKNNTVEESDNGIRIKTVKDQVGSVSNITYQDITLKNIRKVGITIQGNYKNGGPKGDPTPGIPVTHLKMLNIHGTVLPKGTNYLIWVANASDWTLSTDVTGGNKIRECKGFPEGVTPLC